VNTPPRTMGAMDARHHRSRPFPEAPPAQRAANDLRLAALMQAAQDGDRIAYAGLLRELVPLLQRLMRRRLASCSRATARIWCRNILLSLHAARATYDPRRPFTPWLMSIAHHRMVDRARRHTRVWANEVLVDEFADSALTRCQSCPIANTAIRSRSDEQ